MVIVCITNDHTPKPLYAINSAHPPEIMTLDNDDIA